jgi:cellulose synthase/poly-beta-1,6-N-acetylglucosamine synthase-like glycosyltransferase
METPLVSIVLPTYNGATWLGDAIASVRAQSWQEWEPLIVDDGSTDDTAQSLAADQRIRLVSRLHTGNLAWWPNFAEASAQAGRSADRNDSPSCRPRPAARHERLAVTVLNIEQTASNRSAILVSTFMAQTAR